MAVAPRKGIIKNDLNVFERGENLLLHFVKSIVTNRVGKITFLKVAWHLRVKGGVFIFIAFTFIVDQVLFVIEIF